MALLTACALLALASLAAAQCPQDQAAFNIRNQYEVQTDRDGFDLTLWNRVGVNFFGEALSGGTPNDGTDTTVTGAAAASANVFPTLATFQDLVDNGDQWFVVTGEINANGVQDQEACMVEVGDIGSPGGLCATAEGDLLFPNDFAIRVEQHAVAGAANPDNSNAFGLRIRRFADETAEIIRLDIRSNVNGVQVERTGLPASVWDVDSGISITAPDDADPMTPPSTLSIVELIVLEGRGDLDASATTAFATAGNLPTGDCILQTWTTSDSPVIAGSGENNLELTFTRINLGVGPTAQATGDVTFAPLLNDENNAVSTSTECEGEFLITNFTSVSTQGVTFNAATFSGAAQTATFPVLARGATQSITFTATLSSAFPTTVDPNPFDAQAVVDITGFPDSEIYVQRRSNLVFIVEDQRPFNLQNLPIAAGCDVPFGYTVDVFNEGPSCVEDLQISTQSEVVQNCAGNGDAGASTTPDIVIDRIEPQQLAETDPFAFEFSATGDAQNAQELERFLLLQSPLNGGITAENQQTPIDEAADIVNEPEDRSLLELTYDVARYADVQVSFSFDEPRSVAAGEFDVGADSNLCGTLSVSNEGCIDLQNVRLQAQIDVPAGAFLVPQNAATSFAATDAAGDTTNVGAEANAFVQALTGNAGVTIGDSAGNAAGPLGPENFRRINWDAPIVPFEMPGDFFSARVTRGLVLSSASDEFRVSNDGSGDDSFSSIAPAISDDFSPFSNQRIFGVLNENVVDITFFVPASSTPATVNGFGAMFSDVDRDDDTKIEYFGLDGQNLGSEVVDASPSGLSFAGRVSTEPIARVRITLGTRALAEGATETGALDVVVLDDFFYGEPQAIVGSVQNGLEEARAKKEHLTVPALAQGQTVEFRRCFAVCDNARFAPSGVRVRAEVLAVGDLRANLHEIENGQQPATGCDLDPLVRTFDDRTDKAAPVTLAADVDVTLRCEAPQLIATSKFDEAISDDTSDSTTDGDVDLLKVTRCTVTVDNSAGSLVPLKVLIDYNLPSSTRLARWKTSSGQFANGAWAVEARRDSAKFQPASCHSINGPTPTLELDFASTRPGEFTVVARVDTSVSSATFSQSSKLGNAQDVSV